MAYYNRTSLMFVLFDKINYLVYHFLEIIIKWYAWLFLVSVPLVKLVPT